MYRRTFIALTGATALAGCLGGDAGPTVDASPTPTATSTDVDAGPSTATPDTTVTPGSAPGDDLRADAVRSTGFGRGTSSRFTAHGGPVVVTLAFDYAHMRNSNFIVKLLDSNGDHLPPSVFWVNELLMPDRLADDPGTYRVRWVTSLEPGDYFVDVTHAGGPYGDGSWEAVVEQPGIPTTGRSGPFTVDGYDPSVVGPVALSGPTRFTLETLEPTFGATGDPSTVNYWVTLADDRGRPGNRFINSVERGPVTHTAVVFPDTAVGYFNVRSPGRWRATVDPA